MRHILLLLLIISSASAQVGFNNPNPDASSLLDLTANDKGLLIPRMSSAQRDAIGSPAESLLVFDTDKQGFYFQQGGNWYALNEWVKNANNNDVSLAGNASVTGTVTTGAVSSGSINNLGAISTVSLNVSGFSINALVPSGAIIMWNGSVPPAGWALCDGGNGTPNLRDRFIVGVGSGYGVGNTGGEASHVLTTNEMPAHTHTLNDPSHNHTSGNYNRILRLQVVGGTGTTVADIDHTVGEVDLINTSTMPSSTTGISINSSGNSVAHENRPPYYALAYIMKL